jgi:outer membrane lipoprotein-sorting protein
VLAVALAVPASGQLLSAGASTTLPPRTAEQLLADLQGARVEGLSGTVVQRSELGLPQLPGVGGSSGSSSLTSLIGGTHTMRVWYSGPDKARMALLGTLGESDVVVNGRDVWVWSSADKSAVHRRLPTHTNGQTETPAEVPATPAEAARKALAAVDPTTRVSTAPAAATVAGRPAYELLLAPRDTRSLVGQVRIAIDSATKLPLRVQVVPVNRRSAAFEVGFTQVSFGRPDAANFRFIPPPGTKVTESTDRPEKGRAEKHSAEKHSADKAAAAAAPRVVGTGWTTVVVAKAPQLAGSAGLRSIVASLPRVQEGRLLRSSLFSVLFTDDGRVVAGAVAPDLLYAAAR